MTTVEAVALVRERMALDPYISGASEVILEEERAKGAAAEREACAKLVEEGDGLRWDEQGIPAAIRARGAS